MYEHVKFSILIKLTRRKLFSDLNDEYIENKQLRTYYQCRLVSRRVDRWITISVHLSTP